MKGCRGRRQGRHCPGVRVSAARSVRTRPFCPRFFAKFSQIVSKEQATNFITVLHNSELAVIPWSVIQSRTFYALFGKLRNILPSQKCTHGTAGEFLITLKALMARLMVTASLKRDYPRANPSCRLKIGDRSIVRSAVSSRPCNASLMTLNRDGHQPSR